jgi:hypothetical protein
MKYNINRDNILFKASKLESELITFLEENETHTFQRWLLTLTPEETHQLNVDWEEIMEDETSDKISLMPLIIFMDRGHEAVSEEDYEALINEVTAALALIDMVKMGILVYKMEEEDGDWQFKIEDDMKEEIEQWRKDGGNLDDIL